MVERIFEIIIIKCLQQRNTNMVTSDQKEKQL